MTCTAASSSICDLTQTLSARSLDPSVARVAIGGPSVTRTHDRPVMSRQLLPPELWARAPASQAPNGSFCKSTVEEPAQPPRADRMAELPQRLRLDLANPLARDREARTDLLQGEVGPLADAEAQAQHLLLAGR